MTTFAIIVGWVVIVVLLLPTGLNWAAASPLVLGAFLYSQLAGAQYSLAIIKPRRDLLFAAGTVAAAAFIGYGMRSVVLPTDSIGFVAAWIVACTVFWLTVGRRLHLRAMERISSARNGDNMISKIKPSFPPISQGKSGSMGGALAGRREYGSLDGFEIIGDPKYGGMGKVIPVRSPEDRPFAAKTFQIFDQPDSLLLGLADVTDWAGLMSLLHNGDSPLANIIRQCLDAIDPETVALTDGTEPTSNALKARLLKGLNAIIDGENLLKRVSEDDLDDEPRDLRRELQELPMDDPARRPKGRRFGRLIVQSAFGTAVRASTILSTDVRHELVERFREEARTWLELGSHPNLVQAHRVIEVDGRPYVLLDYVGGGTLGAHINNRIGRSQAAREELPEVLRFALQICHGMSFATDRIADIRHGAQFVHGDLKPDNCLLDAGRVVKITDLGLSRVFTGDAAKTDAIGGSRSLTTAGGTLEYMAPELFIDQAPHVRSDIYAFGATLFHVLTGEPPYLDLNALDFSFLDRISPDNDISAKLQSILRTCLAREPEDRYTDFAAVAADLAPLYERLASETFAVSDAGTSNETKSAFLELANRGLSFLNLGLFDDAVFWYHKALEVDPSDARSWNNLGQAQWLLGRADAALQSFETAIKRDPHLSGLWTNKGIIHEQRGALDEALSCYREALRRNPDRQEYIDALNNIGNVHGRRAEYQEAIESFDKVLAVAPRCAEAWSNKGTALIHLERYDDALECYNRSLDINPMLADAWYCKGSILRIQGKTAEALEALSQVLELNPKDRQARDDYEAIKAAADGSPTSSATAEADQYWYQALELESLGRIDKALKSYQHVVRVNPQFSEAWFNIGNIYMGKQNFGKAIKNYNRSVEAFDSSYQPVPDGVRLIARVLYNKAKAHEALGELEQSVAAYDDALRRFPKYAKALWNRGIILTRLDRNREAADSLECAIDLDPSSAAGAPEHKARAYIRSLRSHG